MVIPRSLKILTMKAFRELHYVDDRDEDTEVKVLGESSRKVPDFVDLDGSEKDEELSGS
ncbi:UNVERIFIED_CONTAM: hypothetical protein Slati_3068700 [Sesamum latifolium]|uniref:Uncharacterized protein n=1 Tax=Sesamum latifolium TaxID=2727402 RepID=A0AAW2UTX5_9LAMI